MSVVGLCSRVNVRSERKRRSPTLSPHLGRYRNHPDAGQGPPARCTGIETRESEWAWETPSCYCGADWLVRVAVESHAPPVAVVSPAGASRPSRRDFKFQVRLGVRLPYHDWSPGRLARACRHIDSGPLRFGCCSIRDPPVPLRLPTSRVAG
jgi:hypothetical protein